MCLTKHDEEYVVLLNGKTLMSSRMHGSEEALAMIGCAYLRNAERPRVLVGGLGMGFTLRAALDVLPSDAIVVVAELVPAVVQWNRGPLSALAGHPLRDRRVRIDVNDVGFTLRGNPHGFDAVLLDVDNGPRAFTSELNRGLYDDAGVAAAYAALHHQGVLAVWSAWEDHTFEQRLRHHGFVAQTERVPARLEMRGQHHTVFVGFKPNQSACGQSA